MIDGRRIHSAILLRFRPNASSYRCASTVSKLSLQKIIQKHFADKLNTFVWVCMCVEQFYWLCISFRLFSVFVGGGHSSHRHARLLLSADVSPVGGGSGQSALEKCYKNNLLKMVDNLFWYKIYRVLSFSLCLFLYSNDLDKRNAVCWFLSVIVCSVARTVLFVARIICCPHKSARPKVIGFKYIYTFWKTNGPKKLLHSLMLFFRSQFFPLIFYLS